MIESLYKPKIIVLTFFRRVIVINIIHNKFCYTCTWWLDMAISLERNARVWMNSTLNVLKNRDISVRDWAALRKFFFVFVCDCV